MQSYNLNVLWSLEDVVEEFGLCQVYCRTFDVPYVHVRLEIFTYVLMKKNARNFILPQHLTSNNYNYN